MTKLDWLVQCVSLLLYILLLSGLASAFREELTGLWYRISMKRRLTRGIGSGKMEEWEEALRRMLLTATGKEIRTGMFALFTVLLMAFVFLGTWKKISAGTALFAALICGTIPFLLLYIKVEQVRRKGSREGEVLMAEFLRQYRISEGVLFPCLERMVESPGRYPLTRKRLFHLLLELRATGKPERIRKATDDFAFFLNTNWGRMLAYNIYLSAAEGTDVSLGLEDILIQLRDARLLEEGRKRMNGESVRMTLFMVPGTYLLTMLLSSKCLDVSLQQFLHNQFGTGEGVFFFLLILFFFVLNLALLSLIGNQRFDY